MDEGEDYFRILITTIHSSWAAFQIKDKWRYDALYFEENKTNPDLTFFGSISFEARTFDYEMVSLFIIALYNKGYLIRNKKN